MLFYIIIIFWWILYIKTTQFNFLFFKIVFPNNEKTTSLSGHCNPQIRVLQPIKCSTFLHLLNWVKISGTNKPFEASQSYITSATYICYSNEKPPFFSTLNEWKMLHCPPSTQEKQLKKERWPVDSSMGWWIQNWNDKILVGDKKNVTETKKMLQRQ